MTALRDLHKDDKPREKLLNKGVEALKNDIIHLDLEDKVIFTGFTTEVDTHLQLCNLTVLATENETFGLVVIESMANGVPVIATNKGGPLEIIKNGVDGYFFDGTIQNLTDQIQMFYNDKRLQKKISIETLEKVKKKFNETTQLTKLVTIIDKM